jgi:hypothetical protein
VRKSLGVAIGATLALGLLAWSQPAQFGPYGVWQARITNRHCVVWNAVVLDRTPLEIQECDGPFASR